MIIKELHSETTNKYAIIKLDYNEIRDISNSLYEFSKQGQCTTDVHIVHRNIAALFQLVKHGCLDSASIELLSKLQLEINKSKTKDFKS